MSQFPPMLEAAPDASAPLSNSEPLVESCVEERGPDVLARQIVFMVGDREFAFPAQFASEVRRADELEPALSGPPWLAGLVAVRGARLWVVNLYAFLRMKVPAACPESHIVVVRSGPGKERRGLLVHRVAGVRTLHVNRITVPPSLRTVRAGAYLRGVADHQDKPVFLLDVECLLNVPELQNI